MGEWIAEHPVAALAAAAVICTLLAAGGVVLLVWLGRRLRQRPLLWLPFLALAPATLLALLGGTLMGLRAAALYGAHQAFRGLTGRPAPDVAFTDLDTGEPRRLSDYRGQVVLVNRWATWCAPCRHEIPDLERLYAEYRDRGLVVLLLSDEPPETQRAFFEDAPYVLERGYADEFPELPCPGYPTSYIVDREGIIREAFVGARTYRIFAEAVAPYL